MILGNVFDDPHADSLDFLITTLEDPMDWDELMKEAKHIGWLSGRDFEFMKTLMTEVYDRGIPLRQYSDGFLIVDHCKQIEPELDKFVIEMNKISRSDQNANRSVMRLRALIDYSIKNNVNLYMVSD